MDLEHRSEIIVSEMIRRVCLIIMSRLKEQFSFFASERSQLQEDFIMFMTSYAQHITTKHNDIKLWALVTAASMHERTTRSTLIALLADAMTVSGVETADELLDFARDVLYISILQSPYEDELVDEVCKYLRLAATI